MKYSTQMRILFLAMYDDEDYLVEGMQVGASGYVLKDSPSAQLVAAVRDATNKAQAVAASKLGPLAGGLGMGGGLPF